LFSILNLFDVKSEINFHFFSYSFIYSSYLTQYLFNSMTTRYPILIDTPDPLYQEWNERKCKLHTLVGIPTLSQDNRTLAVDDNHLQIFNELLGKLQDILKAVKAIVAARKKGRSGRADADGIGELFTVPHIVRSESAGLCAIPDRTPERTHRSPDQTQPRKLPAPPATIYITLPNLT
jgi:uncharacterized protein (UPF0335 family)